MSDEAEETGDSERVRAVRSDPAPEEAPYNSVVMRQFMGIDVGREKCRTSPLCASSVTCWMSPASHSIDVALTFIEIAIAELDPHYMRGYGRVSDEGATDLYGVVAELQSAVKELHRYIL